MGSTLHLALPGSGWMLIFLRVPTIDKDTKLDLMVQGSDKVDILRYMIGYMKSIPRSHQTIIFWGRELEDGCTQADYGVVEGLFLSVVIRLPRQRGASCPGCARSIAWWRGEVNSSFDLWWIEIRF